MRGMVSYTQAAMERAMKVQEVIWRAMAKKITWWQAAEIIGVSERSMRRWRERYAEFGYDGLFDRRLGQPSPKRAALATVEQVLGLYRDAISISTYDTFTRSCARSTHPPELHLGEAGVARSRVGATRAQTGSASPAASAAASARHALAHRWQSASLVSG
jgi:leucine-zipper of insertion element IS481